MKRLIVLSLTLCLSACAAPRAVQRMGVEYNTAIAGMANELTLLNIVRAKEDMPLHYTSVSRLSGSLVVKATSSINGQLKDSARTTNSTHQTALAPAGLTTTDTLLSTLTKGGNVYTPALGGEITSGPSFDIAILDTQKFYQGVLAAVPFPTVENYINQDFDNQLLIRVIVERVEYVAKADVAGTTIKKGDVIRTLENVASGDKAKAFASELACYRLIGVSGKKPPKPLTPLSRLTVGADGKARPLKMDELAKLDGKTLDLEGSVLSDGSTDGTVTVNRLHEEKRIARLKLLDTCGSITSIAAPDKPVTIATPPQEIPDSPPAEAVYAGTGKVMILDPRTKNSDLLVDVDLQIVFRSPEGVLRYIGQYLNGKPGETYRVGRLPLFAVSQGNVSNPIVATELLGTRYAITNDDEAMRRRNMMVLGLAEQLINLHKESTDRPVTQPVQVIP